MAKKSDKKRKRTVRNSAREERRRPRRPIEPAWDEEEAYDDFAERYTEEIDFRNFEENTPKRKPYRPSEPERDDLPYEEEPNERNTRRFEKKNQKKKKKRKRKLLPTRRPVERVRDEEDMLNEFSDDTNEFYTDESIHSRRREDPRNLKQAKKQAKKQEKRKPKSPLQRKIIRILSYGAIIAVVLIVGVVLSLTVLFKTQAYEVTGVTRYSEEEIIDACGISKGENIFLAPKSAAEKRLKKQFPYVEEANVSFKIPDTIRIAIEEAAEGYLMKLSGSDYLVISTKGRILNQVTDTSAYDLPIFIGPTLTSGAIGDYVSYEDDTVVEMIESITQTFADNGYQGITEIDATDMANISFTYDNRVKVKLGIPEDLDYKVRTAMTIINENLDKNQTGTITGILDVSRCNSTKRSYFNEQEIRPTEVKPSEKPTEAVAGDSGTGDYNGDYSADYNSDYSADGSADGYYTDDYSWYEGAYTDDSYAYYGAYDGYGYYE